MTNNMVDVLIANESNLYSGNNIGIFISTNSGGSWTNISPNTQAGPGCAYSIAVYGQYLLAGNGNGAWRIPLSQLVTGIKNTDKIPMGFELRQNYPNPFNPTTIINYSIPRSSMVTIKVYDVLGREVSTLVNEQKMPGNYKVTFNAGNLASGVYFYQLRASDYTAIKKMLLLK